MAHRPGSAWRGSLLVALVAGALTVALGACGRRGAPEPPNAPATTTTPKAATTASRAGQDALPEPSLNTAAQIATQNTPDDESDGEDITTRVSPQPNISRRRGTPYLKPKEPFILDPLL